MSRAICERCEIKPSEIIFEARAGRRNLWTWLIGWRNWTPYRRLRMCESCSRYVANVIEKATAVPKTHNLGKVTFPGSAKIQRKTAQKKEA